MAELCQTLTARALPLDGHQSINLFTGIYPVSYKSPHHATVQSMFLHLAHKDITRDPQTPC